MVLVHGHVERHQTVRLVPPHKLVVAVDGVGCRHGDHAHFEMGGIQMKVQHVFFRKCIVQQFGSFHAVLQRFAGWDGRGDGFVGEDLRFKMPMLQVERAVQIDA